MRKWWMRLYDAGEGGSGGGAGSGSGQAGEGGAAGGLGNAEAIRLRKQLDALQEKYNKLDDSYKELEGKYTKTTADLEEAGKKLGGYTAAEARKKRLDEMMGKDFKGKYTVDEAKVMKYLAKGEFNAETLDADIKDAIETYGEKVQPASSTLSSRGAGSEGSERPQPDNDPIGSFVRKTFGT